MYDGAPGHCSWRGRAQVHGLEYQGSGVCVVGEGLWGFGGLGHYSWRDGPQVGTQASNIMELMSAMRRRR